MSNKASFIDGKVKTYINELFSGVGASQQLFDLKEELTTNMQEKIADFQSRGMEDNQAFKEAVISMGDLRGLVDDMRELGQDTAKQAVYSTMTARISLAGIVTGVLLVLFGIIEAAMLYFMDLNGVSVAGTGIFIVAGGTLITYSLLIRETRRKYAMNKIRAAFNALAVGLLLFSVFVAIVTRFATGEIYIAIGSFMIFFLIGTGLHLFLILTGTNRRKNI